MHVWQLAVAALSKRRARARMMGLASTQRGAHRQQLIAGDVSVAHGLLDREDLLRKLDRAVTRRVTVVSAPPGSGKTSLLRAWVDRSASSHRVAFVSVERDEQDAQRFWSAVLAAVRSAAGSIELGHSRGDGRAGRRAASRHSRFGVAEYPEPFVLIIDDLQELRSAEARGQLERLLARLPNSARVVLSSRRDPPIRLHQLRLADDVAEIRAADLRFTEREARELLAAAEIDLV